MLNTSPAPPPPLSQLRDDVIIQAVQHHRRAVATLQHLGSVRNPADGTLPLLQRMTCDLQLLEKELQQRGLAVPSDVLLEG